MSNIKATIITIGDELLIGQTIDTNSAWIAQRLNDRGIDVVRRIAVADKAEDIENILNEELPKSDLILITGGLGPTSDDITKPVLCKYFNSKLVVNEAVLAHVKEIFQKRKRPFLEVNLKQAEVPDNCTVLFNRMGTAPGMMFHKDDKTIISMPGVPFEMMTIMDEEVLPYLSKTISSDAIIHRTIFTVGEGESFIAERIKDLELALPDYVKLAYLPNAGMVKLRLTGKGSDKAKLEDKVNKLQLLFASRLENITVSLQDEPLEKIIGRILAKENKSLSLAESCTGGNIAHLITQVPGSSAYFKGGIVCYRAEVKEKVLGVSKQTIDEYGEVSEQTAAEMATRVRTLLNTDYSLSITGILGPDGATDKLKLGTVWMAVANKDTVKTKEFLFHYDRSRNKEMAVQMAMHMIWKFINHQL